MNAIAIILAAGNGKRLGTPKTFLKLGSETLLVRTLRAFDAHPHIGSLIVTVRSRDASRARSLLMHAKLRKPWQVIPGGSTRQRSAAAAVTFLEKQGHSCDTLLVFHNAANPFVTREEINHVMNACTGNVRAAAVALAVTDTIKLIRERKNVPLRNNAARVPAGTFSTLRRDGLFRTQTPQAMRLGTALKAHIAARRDQYAGTDDIELVERLKVPVVLVPASPRNFKITTPLDLKIAQYLTTHS